MGAAREGQAPGQASHPDPHAAAASAEPAQRFVDQLVATAGGKPDEIAKLLARSKRIDDHAVIAALHAKLGNQQTAHILTEAKHELSVGADDASATTTRSRTTSHPDGTANTTTHARGVAVNGDGAQATSTHGTARTAADGSTTAHSHGTSAGAGPDGPQVGANAGAAHTTAHGTTAGAGGAAAVTDHGVAGGGTAGVTSQHGYGANVGFSFSASKTEHEDTKDGRTTLEIDTHVAGSVGAGVSTPEIGVSGAKSQGKDATFRASVPEAEAKGLNLKTLDPSKPGALPPGATLELDSSSFKGTSVGASLDSLAVDSTQTKSKGESLVVEKLDPKRVRVTSGPTEAMSNVTSFGVDFGVAGVALLNQTTLSDATLHSAVYDVTTPEGKRAYAQFLDGKVPKPGTAGAQDVTTIRRADLASKSGVDAHVGPVHLGIGGASSDAHFVTTTNADGTKQVDNQAIVDGHEIDYHEDVDAKGKTTGEKFTLVLHNQHSMDQLLKVIPGAKVSPKDKQFRFDLTRPQLDKFFAAAKHAVKLQGAVGGMDPLAMAAQASSAEQFFAQLGTLFQGEYEEATILMRISDAQNGKLYDNKYGALPGKLT